MFFSQTNISFFLLIPFFAALVLGAATVEAIGAEAEQKMTMIVFGVPYCASCRLMTPVMNELRKKHPERLSIRYLDADDNREEARLRQIQALPTQIILDRQGREVARHLGFWDTESIETELGLRSAPGNKVIQVQTAGKSQ